jgi:site-specific DNA-methyltransferase (adenine-specific)
MRTEAVASGFYTSEFFHKDYPRIQILTVEELLAGRTVQMPTDSLAFKQSERVLADSIEQNVLGFD